MTPNDLKSVLHQALALTERPSTSKEIAAALGVSLSLVNAWRGAKRQPTQQQANKLARHLFPASSERQRWLERSLVSEKIEAKSTLLKELDRNRRALRVGSANVSTYGIPGLLDEWFTRFSRLSTLDHRNLPREELVDLKDQLEKDEIDIGVGLFAALDRSLMIKFFETPIRVGLNAVVLDKTLKRTGWTVEQLRSTIAPEEPERALADSRLQPIVVESDVGGVYASKVLGFGASDVVYPSDRLYSSYVEKLIEEEAQYANLRISKVPIAMVDDFAALSLLLMLYKRGVPGRLVFPFSNDESGGNAKKWMPEYLISIAVKRTNTELVGYLQDALRLFLRIEVQMISSSYLKACEYFEGRMLELCARSRACSGHDPSDFLEPYQAGELEETRKWVRYTFGITPDQLDYHQDFDLPWKAILRKSAKLYQGENPNIASP
jgi:hypothetical protein